MDSCKRAWRTRILWWCNADFRALVTAAMSDSALVWWSVWHWRMAVAVESSGRTTFWMGCCHFLATMMANCGGTCCGFVAGDERQIGGGVLSCGAVISRTESKKLAKCCCCIATAALFRWFSRQGKAFQQQHLTWVFWTCWGESIGSVALARIGQTVASNLMTRFWFELLSFRWASFGQFSGGCGLL